MCIRDSIINEGLDDPVALTFSGRQDPLSPSPLIFNLPTGRIPSIPLSRT